MEAHVIDSLKRTSKEGKTFFMTLVRWQTSDNVSHRAEFFTKNYYSYGDIVLLEPTTQFDKNSGREVARVRVVE